MAYAMGAQKEDRLQIVYNMLCDTKKINAPNEEVERIVSLWVVELVKQLMSNYERATRELMTYDQDLSKDVQKLLKGNDTERLWEEHFFVPSFAEYAVQISIAMHEYNYRLIAQRAYERAVKDVGGALRQQALLKTLGTPQHEDKFIKTAQARFEVKIRNALGKAMKGPNAAGRKPPLPSVPGKPPKKDYSSNLEDVRVRIEALLLQLKGAFQDSLTMYIKKIKKESICDQDEVWSSISRMARGARGNKNGSAALLSWKTFLLMPEHELQKDYYSMKELQMVCMAYGLSDDALRGKSLEEMWSRFRQMWKWTAMVSMYYQIQFIAQKFPGWLRTYDTNDTGTPEERALRLKQMDLVCSAWDEITQQKDEDTEDKKDARYARVFRNMIKVELLGKLPEELEKGCPVRPPIDDFMAMELTKYQTLEERGPQRSKSDTPAIKPDVRPSKGKINLMKKTGLSRSKSMGRIPNRNYKP